ncbi:2OG-Fe(II) oxygenase [Nocardia sp. alder85J]|uniref:2OG-Fe(II) oxygenase n=1 Tax=Nocardia sp. alder85J TaxID=2862949 RepID=UPI001CD481CB|nr:2OG-Fe(II) oxygenase [Nocardia sp. alder85J]MCX4095790.1 2OG-Fe(II) oxygenase [Nocardia sp. alder85J]
MTDETLRAIGEFLRSVPPPGSFVARRTASAADLAIEVEGIGRLRLPVPMAQARQLRDTARPARYGMGAKTLLDPSVRDTGEIPLALVTVDQDRWHRALAPILEALRFDLGLPPDCELSAELHSMLVYGPRQFFRRHQDSEKSDGMIATLVVTLPSFFEGGELVVEHRGEQVVDRGAPGRLGLVAFYTDCEHEVRPVQLGHRISLTYNLIAGPRAVPTAAPGAPDPAVAALAEHLREHFTTPIPDGHRGQYRPEGPELERPDQLVCLLDHQYSQRGFGWDQLKGADAARVEVLVAAADSAGYGTVLALAEVQDYHSSDDLADEFWMCGRRRRWELVDGNWELVVDDWEPNEMLDEPQEEERTEGSLPIDHPDRMTPAELGRPHRADTRLTWWIDRAGAVTGPVARTVSRSEICVDTTEFEMEPFAVESEGFTGNEGNTVDRWYRRAAVVVRPGSGPA